MTLSLPSPTPPRLSGLLADIDNSLTSKLPVLVKKKQIASLVNPLKGLTQDKNVIFALI